MDIHGPYGPMDPSTHDSSGRHLRQTFWLVHMAPAWHGWLRWSQESAPSVFRCKLDIGIMLEMMPQVVIVHFRSFEHVPKLIPDGDGNLSTVSISSGYLKKTFKNITHVVLFQSFNYQFDIYIYVLFHVFQTYLTRKKTSC